METITEMDLARLVFGADEMKCESRHRVPENKTCSGEVVAIKSTCTGSILICQNSASYNMEHMSGFCSACHKPCADHWTIRPI